MSEEFLKWMLAGIGAAILSVIGWLAKELREARKEMREDAQQSRAASERRTDQFVTLHAESIESRGAVAAVMSKLVDEVKDIPCNAGRSNSGGGL